MRYRLSYIISPLLLALLVQTAVGDSARQVMKRGLNKYKEGQFDTAIQYFEDAAAVASKEDLAEAVAHYNRGNALFRNQQMDKTGEAYESALRTHDLGLQSRALYNRATASQLMAGQLAEQQQMEPAMQHMTQSLQDYKQAMRLNPDDPDYKVNYELALRLQKKLEQMQQQQQKQDQQKQDKNSEKDEKKQEDPQQQQQEQKDPQEQKDQDQQQQADNQEEQEDQQQEAQPKEAKEMTQEEAEMLLNAMRREEELNREKAQLFKSKAIPVDRNW